MSEYFVPFPNWLANWETKSTIEVYSQAYYGFEQDDWMRWLPMAEFANKNSRQANNIISPFQTLLGYYLRISYENNRDSWSKSWVENKEAVALRKLRREIKTNLAESQELQILYRNKNVKNAPTGLDNLFG